MFAAPELSGTYVKLDYGTGLYINCWAYGQNVSGPWGTSNIWDYVNWTTNADFRGEEPTLTEGGKRC